MNLEAASFIAQIIGGIAVVLSLVYVGMQIKQNTKAARMTAAQMHQAMFGNIEELFSTDQQLVELVLRAARGDEVSPAEQWRLTGLFRHVLRTWQTGHFMYTTGVLDKAIWLTQAALFEGIIQQDRALQDHFKRERPTLDRAFAEYIDAALRKNVSFDALPNGRANRSPNGQITEPSHGSAA